jgi:aspartyl-tRNA(Asn)/glutamyl-tRNA(Gln) amidotransferase subunit B
MPNKTLYQAVIGLEIHAQLATNSKLFCGDATSFGADPNTHVSPITLGHPGTLPKTNAKAVEYAIQMGLACGSTIAKENYFARKNYFYADLPKGYQISQHSTPICVGGHVTIQTNEGEKQIQLNRIHLEEDAGKSIHDLSPTDSLIDLNRAGTPLIEMVTEPCIHSAEDAFLYVTEVRKLVRWLGICDGNMEEGSLRCDANISVRLKGEEKLGTRVEVKNLNSIRNIKKAIEFEIDRLITLVENGETIIQQTRSFDANNDTTFSIRDKEDANDYRYFPDPDLAPLLLTDDDIQSIQSNLPALPNALKKAWSQQFGLSAYDIDQLCENKQAADFYLLWTQHTTLYKTAANFMIGPIRAYLNEHHKTYSDLIALLPQLSELLNMVDQQLVSFTIATDQVLNAVLNHGVAPMEFASANALLQNSNEAELTAWIQEVLSSHPDKVEAYKKGKKGLIGVFVGDVKRLSKGQADPQKTTQLLETILSK